MKKVLLILCAGIMFTMAGCGNGSSGAGIDQSCGSRFFCEKYEAACWYKPLILRGFNIEVLFKFTYA